MKVTKTALLLIGLPSTVVAFLHHQSTRNAPAGLGSVSLRMAEVDSATADLSIPYDAPARLAYDEWRQEFNKGPFDEKRFNNFKANYESIAVANVIAKKKARDEGREVGSLMTLNEYGDLTEEEYKNMKTSGNAVTTGDVLGKAMEAAQSQSEASAALEEAANALAEEEEALAKKLGLNSVEELEVALDSLEGIADDGGELDKENLAREARIRSAYLKWCKDFKKPQDEKRFVNFFNNFLTMEKLTQETGKEMQLNEYADFSEQEFKDLQNRSKPSSTSSSSKGPSAVEKAKAMLSSFSPPKINLPSIQIDDTPESPETTKAREEALKQQQALRQEQAKKEAERRAELEKEKAERQKAQEQELSKLNASFESEAIQAAKQAAEAEAKMLAKQKELDDLAAKEARQKAQAWEAKQKQIAQSKVTPVKKKKPVGLNLSAVFPNKSPQGKVTAAAKPKPAPTMSKKPSSKPQIDFGSLFQGTPKKEVSKPKVAPAPTKAPVKKKEPASPAIDFGSFFSASKNSPKSKPSPAPVQSKEVDVADPVTDAFNSFFGVKKVEKPVALKKPAQTSKPATPRPSFSLFSPPAKKDAPKPASQPEKEAKKSPFSMFSPAKSSSAGTTTIKQEQPKKKVPPKIPNRGGTISLFSSASVKKEKPDVPPPRKSSPKAIASPARPTLSIFGSGQKPAPQTESKTPVKKTESPSFSLFGPKKASTPASSKVDPSIPIISKWKQNPDGSITGKISNSKNFRSGTEITTSPVRRGAKAGNVVRTGSGSKYLLN